MKHRRALKPALNRIVPPWIRRAAWLAVAAWAAAVTVLSSLTPRDLQAIAPFEFWDKAAHFAAFAAGAVLLALALRWSTAWPWRRIAVTSIVAISAFGAVDEFHQTYTPNRSGADRLDWLADTFGAIAGALLTASLHARFTRPPRLAPAAD